MLWAAIVWLLASGGVAWLLAERAHASGSSVPPVNNIARVAPTPDPFPQPAGSTSATSHPTFPRPTGSTSAASNPAFPRPTASTSLCIAWGLAMGICAGLIRQPLPIRFFLRAGAVVEQAVDLSLPVPAPGWAAVRTRAAWRRNRLGSPGE